jgi:hypothetical protein
LNGDYAFTAESNDSKRTSPSVRAEQWLEGALGVRHHPEHVAARIGDTRDVVERGVGVGRGGDGPGGVGVAEDDLSGVFERLEAIVGDGEASVAVRDRDAEELPGW